MKRFYLLYYQEDKKVQQAVALLPWGHNLLLMNYNLTTDHIIFYSNEVCSKGWSRDMLRHAIKAEYHLSALQVDKSNNFLQTLSPKSAEYANEVFRSTYNIGFIDATEPLKELDLEKRLVNKITSFIMELGHGFSFIGNQYTLTYNHKESPSYSTFNADARTVRPYNYFSFFLTGSDLNRLSDRFAILPFLRTFAPRHQRLVTINHYFILIFNRYDKRK